MKSMKTTSSSPTIQALAKTLCGEIGSAKWLMNAARGRAFHRTALQYTGLLHPPVGTVDKLGQVAALPGSFSNSPELHSYVLENSAHSNSLFAIPHR